MFYKDRKIQAEFVPVTDFREAKCRKHTDGHCDRGGNCNFLHAKHVMNYQKKEMFDWMYQEYPVYKEAKKEREENPEKYGVVKTSRSRSRDRYRKNQERDRPPRASERGGHGGDRYGRDSRYGDSQRYERSDRYGGGRDRDDRYGGVRGADERYRVDDRRENHRDDRYGSRNTYGGNNNTNNNDRVKTEGGDNNSQ